MKGEDILLSTPSTQLVKFHRLRASVPGKLWRWQVVTGWKWRHGKEHINSLELRAILNAVRWRIEHGGHDNHRMLRLTDSLVCLRGAGPALGGFGALCLASTRSFSVLTLSSSGHTCPQTRTLRISQAAGGLVSSQSLETHKGILEGGTEQERARCENNSVASTC